MMKSLHLILKQYYACQLSYDLFLYIIILHMLQTDYRKRNCLKITLVALTLASCLMVKSTNSLSAKLQILTYEPLYLNLSFSEPIIYPQFQLLINQPAIQHIAISNTSEIASSYIIQGIIPDDLRPQDYVYQKYKLIFSFPLKVGNGNLELGSFLIKAQPVKTQRENILLPISEKNSHFAYQNEHSQLNSLAIVIVVVSYFLAMTTIIGLSAYLFLTVYIFISILSPLYTYMDYKIAFYLLCEVHEVSGNQQHQFLYLTIPYILIAGSLILGLISRFTLQAKAKQTWFWNQIYYFFTYRLFLSVWNIMVIPIIINMVHLMQDTDHFVIISKVAQYAFIYIGFAVVLLFLVLNFTVLNPQINQSAQKFQQYAKSNHIILYESLYKGIQPIDWKKRNYTLFVTSVRIVILALVGIFINLIPNLVLQIAILIYLFIVRPFKLDFFNHIQIGIQISVVLFYLYNYTVTLFVRMSGQLITSSDMDTILLVNVVLVSLLMLSFLVLGLFQFYQKIKELIISNKQWNTIKKKYDVVTDHGNAKFQQTTIRSKLNGDEMDREFTRRKSSITKNDKKQHMSQVYGNKKAGLKINTGYRQASEQIDIKRSRKLKTPTTRLQPLLEENQQQPVLQKSVIAHKQQKTSPDKKKSIKKTSKKKIGQKQSLLQTIVKDNDDS